MSASLNGIESRLDKLEARWQPEQRLVICHVYAHQGDSPAQAERRKQQAIAAAEATAEPALPGQ